MGEARAHVPSPAGQPRLTWDWSTAALGAAYAIPAAIAVPGNVTRGVAMAVGVLPAAASGLRPTRRQRRTTVALGAFTGLPILLGSVVSNIPWLAVITIVALAVGASLLAARSRIGQIAMVLCLPMVGVGLSYNDIGEAAGLAGLMIAGSVFAWLVSLLWPERVEPAPPAGPQGPLAPALVYGLRLGAAAATAATIGFVLDLDHVGWACAAALLVMRPQADMQRLRSVGRVLSVALGALLAIAFIVVNPGVGWYSVAVIAAIAGVSATHGSRWYVTSAFTTYLVFLMLLYSDPDAANYRFAERLGETVLGVGLAYFFGLVLPAISAARKERAADSG